ncbi:MAG: type II toxin-antitoxin system PemK/MazF family toxin [bacterium]|nr:type II toxin-antitoxin system PemK/MazF family toxin [bacterium]
MNKDYSEWHRKKTEIQSSDRAIYFYERQIWYCSIGSNVGREQDGKHSDFERPVLVLRKFNRNMFWGIPMTSRKKQSSKHYSLCYKGRESYAILSQLRLFDAKRLRRKVGKISQEDMILIRMAVKQLIP